MKISQRILSPAFRMALVLAAAGAAAQDATTHTDSRIAVTRAGLLERIADSLPGGILGTAAIVTVILLLAVGIVFLIGRRRLESADEVYPEPAAVESSKFEQLLAETQGLFLRIQGGESKGYYRKIEQLARIFLERTGVSGARQLTYEEIQALLAGGAVPQKHAGALISIFERCKQGSEHEGEKIDFTAAELIRDLRALVKQAAEETSSPRGPQRTSSLDS